MDSIEVELMASQAMNERMAQTIGEQDAEIARLRTALAEAQRERDAARMARDHRETEHGAEKERRLAAEADNEELLELLGRYKDLTEALRSRVDYQGRSGGASRRYWIRSMRPTPRSGRRDVVNDTPRCNSCGRFLSTPAAAWEMVYSGWPPMPDRELFRCDRCVDRVGPFEPQVEIRPEFSCGLNSNARSGRRDVGSNCGHSGAGMTVFPVGEDSLMLCSRCYAVVTQPWHDKLRETADALAEAQRELQEIRGVIGFPGAVALAEAGLTESLANVVRYTHRQWLEQTHNSNQRVIRAEAAVDAAQRERDAEKAENEELRADLVWAVRTGIYGHGNLITPGDGTAHSFDGTDADLCRAIREARRGD